MFIPRYNHLCFRLYHKNAKLATYEAVKIDARCPSRTR